MVKYSKFCNIITETLIRHINGLKIKLQKPSRVKFEECKYI